MTYTIDDIKLYICKRATEPKIDLYGSDAEMYFNNSLVELLGMSDQYNPEEVPSLIIEYQSLFDNTDGIGSINISDITNDSIIKIDKIYQEPTKGDNVLFSQVPLSEFFERLNNPNTYPSELEGYWTLSGNKVRYFHGDIGNSLSVNIIVIKNPSLDWGTSDLVSDYKYSTRFIEKCIDMASTKLKIQIGLE